MGALLTAEDVYRDPYAPPEADRIPGALRVYEFLYRRHAGRLALPAPPAGDATAPAATAWVHRGRWIAFCPFGCGRSQVVSKDDPRFYCVGAGACFNEAVGGATVPIVFPSEADLAEIERLLSSRPALNRNWFADEPVQNLVLENMEAGLPA